MSAWSEDIDEEIKIKPENVEDQAHEYEIKRS